MPGSISPGGSRPASLAVNGTGTLFLSGTNSYLGGTTLNSTSPVTVVVNNDDSLGSGPLTLTNGTLIASAGVTLANPVVIPGGAVTLSGTALAGTNPTPLTLSGPVSFPSGTPQQRSPS